VCGILCLDSPLYDDRAWIDDELIYRLNTELECQNNRRICGLDPVGGKSGLGMRRIRNQLLNQFHSWGHIPAQLFLQGMNCDTVTIDEKPIPYDSVRITKISTVI
jgi:hypothetical protein